MCVCVCIPFIQRDKSGPQTFLMPPCLASLKPNLKSIYPFISAPHSASCCFPPAPSTHSDCSVDFIVFFPLSFVLPPLCFFINLHYITVALILWPWINTIYQGRLMFAPLIQTGKSDLGWKMAFLMGGRRVRVRVCVCKGACCGCYVTIPSTSPSPPIWPVT